MSSESENGSGFVWPKVSIVVVNYNQRTDTIECLESLRRLDYPNYEVIVVDNGSTDGSIEVLKKEEPFISARASI